MTITEKNPHFVILDEATMESAINLAHQRLLEEFRGDEDGIEFTLKWSARSPIASALREVLEVEVQDCST